MKRLLLTALFAYATAANAASDTARVLFIGNSFTGINDLPEVTAQLAASLGDVLIKTSQAPGGTTLQYHSTNPATLAFIRAGGWDYVVLQEQSQAPAFPDNQVKTDVIPYAKALSDTIRAHNPCAKIMFYMTWGYRAGDPMNCASYAPLCTYAGMDSLLRLRYKAMSDSNDALLCPAGATWRRIRSLYPAINLYDADDRHPSPAGTYAAACAFYASIFRKSPVGAPFDFTLPPADAANIRAAAKAVTYDSLPYWRQWYKPTLVVKAGFSNSSTGAGAVQFTNTSTNGNTYAWVFGDGATSTLASPSHTYTSAGAYNVRLIAISICGDKDTLERQIALKSTGLGQVPEAALRIMPNPAHDVISITAATDCISTILICDMQGRQHLLQSAEGAPGETFIDISAFPNGVYVVSATAVDGTVVQTRLLKQ